MGAAIDDASADVCLARLSGGGDEPDYEQLRRDSTALLTSAGFAARSPAWQADAIWTVFMRMVSTLHADAGAVAALAAPHFGRLLEDPRVGIPEACRVFDALWGMWWCAASSLDDMRPVYPEVCIPFHRFLARRGLVASDPSPRDERAGPLRIGYLLHYAHGQRGNAVAPLVVSLARAHAVLPDRKVFVYATQWVDEDWLAASFSGSGVTTRCVAQREVYDRLDELFCALRSDALDAVVTDTSSATASVMFARRCSSVQVRLDLGMPYWFQPELDCILLSGKPWRGVYPFPRDRAVEIRMNQERRFLDRAPDAAEVRAARAELPENATIVGVFTRLIKITPAYFDLMRRVLMEHPATHLLVGGTGDPRAVQAFMAKPELAGRVTFLHRNVDLAVYGCAIDIFIDTFPFIGALACREIAAQGVPVLSLRSHEWGLKQDQDRDPSSIAEDIPSFLALIARTVRNPAVRRARALDAAASLNVVTDVAASAREVDAAIAPLVRR